MPAPFEAYGPSHLAVLALFAAAAAALVALGRRLRGTPRERTARRLFAAILVVLVAPWQIWTLLPQNWHLATSLPLELCDLAWLAGIVALATRKPWAFGLLYYWGLTLSSQALFTPTLKEDFPSLAFLMFWTEHLLIVLAAIFMTWGLGLRPTWRDYRRTLLFTAGAMAAMFAFNGAAGTNYMYVNAKPDAASALDALGPWPVYILVGYGIAVTLWALITAVWRPGATRANS